MLNLAQRLRARRFRRLVAAPQFDRPERNLVLTGLPRSGTSLLSSVISGRSNAYCVNEIFYDVARLPLNLAKVRMCLAQGLPVPNKYNAEGRLTTNTARDDVQILYRVIAGDFDCDCLVASNANIPYLNRIQNLIMLGYRILAVVRHPTYTIASWNSPKVRGFPEYRVTAEDFHARWAHLPFTTEDRIERQVVIWRHYAELILALGRSGKLSVMCYEDVVGAGAGCARIPGLAGSALSTPQSFQNMNVAERYGDVDLDRIENCVRAAALGDLYSHLARVASDP